MWDVEGKTRADAEPGTREDSKSAFVKVAHDTMRCEALNWAKQQDECARVRSSAFVLGSSKTEMETRGTEGPMSSRW